MISRYDLRGLGHVSALGASDGYLFKRSTESCVDIDYNLHGVCSSPSHASLDYRSLLWNNLKAAAPQERERKGVAVPCR